MSSPSRSPLAIVGLGCQLPGADSPGRFMHHSLEGVRSLSGAPAEWSQQAGLAHPLVGGFLEDRPPDWKKFRIPPNQLAKMHRMERVLHEVLLQATADAGYSEERSPGERCAIYIGATGPGIDLRIDHTLRLRSPEIEEHLAAALAADPSSAQLLEAVRAHVHEQAPPISSESLTTTASISAGRLSSVLGTEGGHLAIDAGPASSLAALKFAAQALEVGHCDIAVVAGVAPLLSPSTFAVLAARGWLAEREVLALDERGTGTLPGEGAVALVLRRLEDALEEGQRIYATLHALTLEASLKHGVSRLFRLVDRATRACLDAAGVEPDAVAHVELQACGVPDLEAQEYLGLQSALASRRAEPLTVSSAAGQVGFQQAASGMVSLMRAALSLHGRVRAPISGFSAPRAGLTGPIECLAGPSKLPARGLVGVSSVTWGGLAYHALLGPAPAKDEPRAKAPLQRRSGKIAIIGMGAIAPGAPDAATLWTNVISKADAIGDLPLTRFDPGRTVGPILAPGAVIPRLAGTVELPAPDPKWLKVPPKTAAALDPAVLLVARAGEEALRDARYQEGAWDKRRVQVVIGQLAARMREYELELPFVFERYFALAAQALSQQGVPESEIERLRQEARARYLARLPPLNEDSAQHQSGLACASRLAAMYDFSGGVLSVDAACASSLVAIHAAALALANRDADVVLAGGVAFNLVPEYFGALCALGVLSARGMFPFDDRADGFVPGEGAGVVVLKRLEDAEAAKDRIVAVISGIGFASDGRGTAFLAPNPKGHARAVERALQAADVNPDQIGLIEAHGSATRRGDVAEATAYKEVFKVRGRDNPVALGAIKSQIGHLSSAGAMLGLIKTSFAVSEAFLPPMNGGEFPNPEIAFDRLPLALSLEGRVWPLPREGIRRAGVSAFGLGGANYHVIVEEHDNSHRHVRATDPTPTTHKYPIPGRGLSAQRWRVDLVPLSLSSEKRYSLAGKRLILVVDDPGVAAAFARSFAAKGAQLRSVSVAGLTDAAEVEQRVRKVSDELGGAHGVIDLCAFAPGEHFLAQGSVRFGRRIAETTARWHGTARALYEQLRQSKDRSGCYVAVTAMGGDFGFLGDGGNVLGGATAGFLKSLKQELPGVVIKVLDFDHGALHWIVAETTARELEEGSDRIEIGYLAGRRFVVGMRRADFRQDSPVTRTVDPNWVLLFSGGGRGAVFEVAKAVARLGPGPKVIVTGRTPVPIGDEPYLGMDDEAFEAYRKEEMIRQKRESPSLTPVKFAEGFEVQVRARELWRNLQDAYSLGLPIEYEVCDIRDPAEVRALADRVREHHGHIDGIVHGAMVEASKSLPDKTAATVAATTQVKVNGLVNLLEATRKDDLKLVMCFGSGAGRFGNRGQTDYSAANDLMSKCLMAYAHAGRPEVRCVTIDWTAWEGAGAAVRTRKMVESTGVSFITPAEGAYWFINEYMLGRGEREVAIFAERLFHEWPFLGASAEGPNAKAAYDDRGYLLVPSDYPMLECVEKHEANCLVATRKFDLSNDPFLLQHQLHSVPIMPGTFGFEMLSEVAALIRPDLTVLRGEDLIIETPLKFFRAPHANGQPRDVPVVVTMMAQIVEQRGEEVVVEVESSSELTLGKMSRMQRRVHHRGQFILGPPPKLEPGTGQLPAALPGSRARSIFHLAKDPVYLGPMFCRAEWVYVGEREVEGIIRAPRQRDIFARMSFPRFQVDPLILDSAFQVAANWDGHHHNLVSIPMGVAALTRGRPRRIGEAAHVQARLLKVDGDEVTYDIDVRGEDGALLLGVKALWLRRLRDPSKAI